MRIRLYLLTVLVCLFALSATSWSNDKPFERRENTGVNTTETGATLDDHPWGDDQSIAQPRPGATTVRTRTATVSKLDVFLLESRLYFINMITRWTSSSSKHAIQPGTTTGTVPTTTTNSTTVSDGVQ